MQRILLISLIILLLFSCKKDDDENARIAPDPKITFIWQGFHHDWTYNHRVNRMGDWISNVDYSNGYKADFKHSAASGIGADECSYKTFATVLATTADIQFSSGNVETILQGVEGTISESIIPVSIDLPPISDPEVVVLLNGFDMYSRPLWMDDVMGDGAADKLFHLELRPQDVNVVASANATSINFDLYAAMGADCASPECINGPVSDFFDYIIEIGYQVIAGPSSVLSTTSKQVDQQYDWQQPNEDQSNEIYRDDFRLEAVQINGQPGIGLGVPGISSVSFQMEQGLGGFSGEELEYQHMLNFDMALIEPVYDVASGLLTTDIDLFFKNWTAPVPVVSFGGGGSVDWSLGVELLQINDDEGRAEQLEYANSIVWNTDPFNPDWPTSSAAVKVERVSVGF
ncbi:MAG: hypothetical protein GY751_06035 [Bacteroidetes bacterium]|nr:hypothetical protein [Bacteroidota bacterium]